MADKDFKIGFIGLGVMGYPMAGHLHRAGLDVLAWNRSPERATAWASEYNGRASSDLNDLTDCNLIISCIGKDDDLLSVFSGKEGLLARLPEGAIVVDHTTASATVARQLAQEAEHLGKSFLDAPISGGQQGAENGQLTIMCGGDNATFDRVKPVLAHYGRAVTLMGPSGAGQLTKMCNQIAIGGLLQALSESIHFAETSGLDVHQVIDVISKGAAQSWQMENRGHTMADGRFDFGFAVELMRKDLRICLEQARELGASLPVTAQVDQYYADVEALGGRRWDTSSLIQRLRALHPED
ncbi:MAG: NAD(P)-dependent oxidoreductase [Gammaproteobacteria bacterium]|nr:MAG: NAD(P)-dependent oxidoreductase [Gammaproteobacteria bacterium]